MKNKPIIFALFAAAIVTAASFNQPNPETRPIGYLYGFSIMPDFCRCVFLEKKPDHCTWQRVEGYGGVIFVSPRPLDWQQPWEAKGDALGNWSIRLPNGEELASN